MADGGIAAAFLPGVDRRQVSSPLLSARKPCSAAEYKRAMKRLAAHCKRSLGAGVDNSLSNAARILRMAGGIHPKTGEMARCISSGGQKYSLEQLWNLTGDDPYVEVSEATRNAVASFYEPTPRTPLVPERLFGGRTARVPRPGIP